MSVEKIIEIIVQYGLPTLLLFGVCWAYYKKDLAFAAEQKARIEDAKILYERLAKSQEILADVAAKWSDENAVRTLTRELIETAGALKVLADDIKQRERDALRDTQGGVRARNPGGIR